MPVKQTGGWGDSSNKGAPKEDMETREKIWVLNHLYAEKTCAADREK